MSENDNLSKIKVSYSTFSYDGKTSLLSVLALEITIRARGAYPEETDEKIDPKKLVGFNEIQHTIMGQLVKMLVKDEARYPDDVFLDILYEKAEDSSCEKDLFIALETAIDRVRAFST